MKNTLIPLALFLCLSACSSQEKETEGQTTFSHEFNAEKYPEIVKKWTVRSSYYSGFYNAYEFHATLLNTEMTESRIRFQAGLLQWPPEKLQSELEKNLQELSSETFVFLSFFTPSSKDNNLATNKSIWNVYLESQGQRYQGTILKSTAHPTEIMQLYPFHNRWSTPYIVKFRVPTTVVQTTPSRLVITGPLGKADVGFNAL